MMRKVRRAVRFLFGVKPSLALLRFRNSVEATTFASDRIHSCNSIRRSWKGLIKNGTEV